jgi:transcriptional regulator GlxA family with amidase domain
MGTTALDSSSSRSFIESPTTFPGIVVHHIGLVVHPDFHIFDLAICSAFELANKVLAEPFYEIGLLSEQGRSVQTSAGFSIDTAPFSHRQFDTLIVASCNGAEPATPALVQFFSETMPDNRRIGSVLTGAYVLAAAGLLDGRRATIHWYWAAEFKRLFPKVKVEEDRLFINDGNIWTSAGMSAGIDLSIALVEQDLGSNVARAVTNQLVHRRCVGGQSQFFAMSEIRAKTGRIQAVLDYAKANLNSELSVDDLARIARLSRRQFTRVFHAETGRSPSKAIENLRLESARLLLEAGNGTVDSVAKDAGFGDRERMRRAFLRTLSQPPQVIQRAFSSWR